MIIGIIGGGAAGMAAALAAAENENVQVILLERQARVGKKLLAVDTDRFKTVCDTIDKIGLASHDVCIVFCGKESTEEESIKIEKYLKSNYKGKEIYIIDGGQDIYDYIIIVE